MMTHPSRRRTGRVRAALVTAITAALWVYDAVDALVSAVLGVPSVTRSAARLVRRVYLAACMSYVNARYGRPGTQVQPHVVDAEIIDGGPRR